MAQNEVLLATKELIHALSRKHKFQPKFFPTKFYDSLQEFAKIYHDTTESYNSKAPRVNETRFTTSIDVTAKTHYRTQPQTHLCYTRANTPISAKPKREGWWTDLEQAPAII